MQPSITMSKCLEKPLQESSHVLELCCEQGHRHWGAGGSTSVLLFLGAWGTKQCRGSGVRGARKLVSAQAGGAQAAFDRALTSSVPFESCPSSRLFFRGRAVVGLGGNGLCEGEQCWGHTLCWENCCLQLSWSSQLLQTAGLPCLCQHKPLDRSLSTKVALGCKSLGLCGSKRVCVCAGRVPLAKELLMCECWGWHSLLSWFSLCVPPESHRDGAQQDPPLPLSVQFLIRVPIYLTKSRGRKKGVKRAGADKLFFVF